MNINVSSSKFYPWGLQPIFWQTLVSLTLGFWLSSGLLLDCVVMPSLYAAGMMSEPGFATAGYVMFSLFNRVELVCAGLILTGLLVLRQGRELFEQKGFGSVVFALVLLGIASIDTYGLTPQMSALGLSLNWVQPVTPAPPAMDQFHELYWSLETLKLGLGVWLLNWCCNKRI